MGIVNVKEIVDNRKNKLKREILDLRDQGIIPKLAVILANDVEASRIYVSNKRKMCNEMGIEEVEYLFDEKATEKDLLDVIEKLNKNDEIDGILVQMPVPKHLDAKEIQNKISYLKDVDGLTDINVGLLMHNKDALVPCTPEGIMDLLDYYKIKVIFLQ